MSGPSPSGAAGRRRVVVTGLGCVSPLGNEIDSSWSALVAGKSGIATVTKFDHSGLPVHFAGEVKGFSIEDYLPAKEARHMDTFIHYGIAAGVQALKDSGIEVTDATQNALGLLWVRASAVCHSLKRLMRSTPIAVHAASRRFLSLDPSST